MIWNICQTLSELLRMSRWIDSLAKQQALISIYAWEPESDFKNVLGLFDDKLKQEGATMAYKLGSALNSQL